jgi:hypothetical protein
LRTVHARVTGARDDRPMHASIYRISGDPDDLLRSYEAMLAEVPVGEIRAHLCLRAPGGIVIVDTCPSREAFESFYRGGEFAALCARHGLPAPDSVEDHPVHMAIVGGAIEAQPIAG